jgi:hypothetical protein
MQRIGLIVVLLALATACGSPSAASPSMAEPSSSLAVDRGLPPGCQVIDLRGPTGERIDLSGEWAVTGTLAGVRETAWLIQVGDCVYGSVTGGEISRGPGITVANLRGRVDDDFVIGLEVLIVTQGDQTLFGTYSTMEMVIEWDDESRLRLREDRRPGETAGRCIVGPYECPPPLIWYRVDDSLET